MPVTAKDWYVDRPWIDEPDADIDGYCRSIAHPEDYDLKDKLEFWQEHGVVIFENAIDTGLIDLMKADLDAIKASPNDHDIVVELAGEQKPISQYDAHTLEHESRLKFCNVQAASTAAAHLSLSSVVTSFLGHIFQSPPCLLQSLLFHKGSQQPLHLDYPYVRTQTKLSRMAASWIPLEDVQADSGPLAYYCGSQKPELMPFFDWGDGNIVMDADAKREPMEFSNHLYSEMDRLEIEPKIFLPKRGDVLIWHAYLAHEGTAIKNPELTRQSYVSHYAPLDSYPKLHKKPNAIKNGHCIAENGGYVFDLPWYKGGRLPWKKPGATLPSKEALPRG